MRKLLVLVLVVFQVLELAAQVQWDYRSGFVVLANKDTLYGEIRVFPMNTRVTKIKFIEKGADVRREYTALDLLSFNYWQDLTYESIERPISGLFGTTYTWFFALRRVTGAINLLKLNITSGEERFYIQNTKYGLTELKDPIEMIHNQVFRDNQYWRAIAKYTNDVPAFQSRIAACGFDEESLVDLISEYNAHYGDKKD